MLQAHTNCRDLGHNKLTGTLPASWGNRTAFQQLTNLTLGYNPLGGTGACLLLLQLCCSGQLGLKSLILASICAGPVPVQWGYATSFPNLDQL